MISLLQNPLFGMTLTLLIFLISDYIFLRVRALNPILLSTILIITILKFCNISYDNYYNGAQIFTILITPATTALAIPLYKNFKIFKKHYKSILSGIIVGNTLNALFVGYACKYLIYEYSITSSFMTKSITTAIAVGLTEKLGGVVSVSIVLVIVTGITGASVAPLIFKILNIDDHIAMGVSLGTSSHAVGTSKAVEISNEAGAISGICIGLTGLYVIIIAPIILKLVLA